SPIASGSSRTHGGGSSRCSALARAVRTAVRLGRRGVTVNDGDVSKSEAMAKPRLGLAIGSGSDHRPRLFSDLLWAICSPWTEFDAPRPASERLCAICSAPAAAADTVTLELWLADSVAITAGAPTAITAPATKASNPLTAADPKGTRRRPRVLTSCIS